MIYIPSERRQDTRVLYFIPTTADRSLDAKQYTMTFNNGVSRNDRAKGGSD